MIRNFVETKCAQYEERVAFARYVYSHLRFFVTRLPQGYSSKHLNQHFERVNSTGKNLEQHEILKVRMLSILGDDANRYVCLWNKLADVDTIIIPKDDTERKRQAIEADGTTAISERFIQGLSDEDDERTLPIGEVPPSPQPPKPDGATHAEGRGILPFPHLLLQVLYRQLGQKPSVEDFFRTSDLLETFERYLLDKNGRIDQVRTFIDNLLKARLALDICFIRRSGDGYSLDMNRTEDDRMLRTLLMFQSMLYVSSDHSTHYRWFGWLMDMVEAHGIPEPERFYRDLKQRADALHPLPSLSSLTYGAMRYWFWRLDFLIWLHREKLFSQKDELKVVERYAFRRNRSIEHVAPRHPKRESTFQWCESDEDATLRDSFGNLVMISQGFNSALSNATYELKRAHVESHLNGSITTPIESLKLLALFAKYEKWDRLSIEEHGKEMYALLSEAYAAD